MVFTGMSLKDSGWINGDQINGSFHLLLNGVYWGYKLLTNLQIPPEKVFGRIG